MFVEEVQFDASELLVCHRSGCHVKVQRTDGGAVVQQVCRTLRYSISFCCYLRRKAGLWKKKTNPGDLSPADISCDVRPESCHTSSRWSVNGYVALITDEASRSCVKDHYPKELQ